MRNNKRRLGVIGIGYSAAPLVDQLMAEGWSVWASTRSEEKADQLRMKGIDPLVWCAPDPLPGDLVAQTTLLVVSVSPTDEGCPALTAMVDTPMQEGARCFYLSSSGVYGDFDGDWVSEETACRPETERGIRRLRAEQGWRDYARKTGTRLTLCRLAGIYGPGRNALASLQDVTRGARAGLNQRVIKPGQVFNRIHRDDIVRGLEKLAEMDEPPAVVNFSDDSPAPPQDVIAYAASLLNVAPPPEVPLSEAALSPMARSFYHDNKRLKNDILKAVLGGELHFPTYQHGLDTIYKGGAF
ncbi:MAG: SDR family oxidoreductase [Pseudomonadota bacterium]